MKKVCKTCYWNDEADSEFFDSFCLKHGYLVDDEEIETCPQWKDKEDEQAKRV